MRDVQAGSDCWCLSACVRVCVCAFVSLSYATCTRGQSCCHGHLASVHSCCALCRWLRWCIWPPPSTTSCPPLAASSLQCYCHFDPGESGLNKPCLRMNTTCTSSTHKACYYFRHRQRLSNEETTVIVQYGCDSPLGPIGNCTGPNTSLALLQCCFTDLCNRNFTSRLPSEMTDATTTPTSTSSEENGRIHSSTPLHVDVTPLSICLQAHNHLLYIWGMI